MFRFSLPLVSLQNGSEILLPVNPPFFRVPHLGFLTRGPGQHAPPGAWGSSLGCAVFSELTLAFVAPLNLHSECACHLGRGDFAMYCHTNTCPARILCSRTPVPRPPTHTIPSSACKSTCLGTTAWVQIFGDSQMTILMFLCPCGAI